MGWFGGTPIFGNTHVCICKFWARHCWNPCFFAQRNLYESGRFKTSNCSAEDRDGMDCPCRHPIFKTSRKTWTPKCPKKWMTNKFKLMINQLTWTQCGPNKQRCFREPFDFIQKCFQMTFKRPWLFSVLFASCIKAISSLGRPHPKTVHSPSWTVSKMAEKCQSVRCHIETTVIPSDSVHSVHFPKVGSARLQILNASNACQDAKVLVASRIQTVGPQPSLTSWEFSYVDESIKQNGPRWWRHCKLPRCLKRHDCGFIRLITKDAPHQLQSLWHGDKPRKRALSDKCQCLGAFVYGRTGFLKNRVHLQELGQNVEVTSFTENMIPNSF